MGVCYVMSILCVSIGGVLGYWEEGHEIVAQIAELYLTPATKLEVTALSKILDDGEYTNFVRSAVWADDIKGIDPVLMHLTSPWHFVDLAVVEGHEFCGRGDWTSSEQTIPHKNIIWALNHYNEVLSDYYSQLKKSTSTKPNLLVNGIALRFIVHLFGDLHQPLHNAMQCSKQHPNGDQGGNGFVVTIPKHPEVKNLHGFWDSGALQYSENSILTNHINSADSDLLHSELVLKRSKEIMSQFPPSFFPSLDPVNVFAIDLWHMEFYDQANKVVYNPVLLPPTRPDLTILPDEYQRIARIQVNKYLALAGYRLANYLNHLIDPPQKEHNQQSFDSYISIFISLLTKFLQK